MKAHRRRETQDREFGTLRWLEMKAGEWLPVTKWDFGHAAIHRMLDAEDDTGKGIMRYDTRAFNIGIISGPVVELEPIL